MDSKQLVDDIVKLRGEVDALRVTEDIIKEWKQHPATRLMLLQLKERQLEGMSEWASRGYQQATELESVRANCEALGGMRVLESITASVEDI